MNYDAAADDADDDDCSLCYAENVNILGLSLSLSRSLRFSIYFAKIAQFNGDVAVDGAAAVASVEPIETEREMC